MNEECPRLIETLITGYTAGIMTMTMLAVLIAMIRKIVLSPDDNEDQRHFMPLPPPEPKGPRLPWPPKK